MKKIAKILSVVLCLVMVLGLMATTTFAAAADHLVISEVYSGGGNSGAIYTYDYVELYNPTTSAISLDGLSVQYCSKKGTDYSGKVDLSGSLDAGAYCLIQFDSQDTTVGIAFPVTPAFTCTGTNIGGDGKIALVNGTTLISTSNLTDSSKVIDHVGMGAASHYETAAAPKGSATKSVTRTNVTEDGNNNSTDFALAAPTPGTGSASAGPTYAKKTIAEVVANPSGDVEVTGVVTMCSQKNVYIADAANENGILCYFSSNQTLAVGTAVTIKGSVAEYKGAPQITVESCTAGEVGTVTAREETDISALGKDKIGEYITIKGLIVDSIDSYGNIVVKQGENTLKIQYPVAEDVGAGDTITFTGVLGWYNGAQLRNTTASEINVTDKAQTPPPAGDDDDNKDDDDDDKDDDVVVTPPAGGTGNIEGIAPVNGATIKLGLWQNGMGKFLYFNGEVANQYYLGTTEDYTAAVNLTVEQVTGGWQLWFMNNGVKTYITMVASGTHVNAVMVTDVPAPLTWNATHKTFTLNVNGEDYYIGTYTKSDGTNYSTLSASKLSYLPSDTSYASHLYTEQPAKTGDISSVFVALLAVSAIGAGALISKKGKFAA